jgi:hypothetical protein
MAYRQTQKANDNVVPPGTVVSLVIPWAEKWQSSDEVARIFCALAWGVISKIDVIPKNTKRPHSTVYIHFSSWNVNEAAKYAYDNITKGNDIKVYYNDSYFWKVRVSNWRPAPVQSFVPRIEVVQVNTQPSTHEQLNANNAPEYSPTSPPYNPGPLNLELDSTLNVPESPTYLPPPGPSSPTVATNSTLG